MDANAVSSLTLGNQGQNLQHAYCMWEVHGYLTTGWRVLGSQTLHGVVKFNIYPLHPIAIMLHEQEVGNADEISEQETEIEIK